MLEANKGVCLDELVMSIVSQTCIITLEIICIIMVQFFFLIFFFIVSIKIYGMYDIVLL